MFGHKNEQVHKLRNPIPQKFSSDKVLPNIFPTCKLPPGLESGRHSEPKPPLDLPRPRASQRRQSGQNVFISFLPPCLPSLIENY